MRTQKGRKSGSRNNNLDHEWQRLGIEAFHADRSLLDTPVNGQRKPRPPSEQRDIKKILFEPTLKRRRLTKAMPMEHHALPFAEWSTLLQGIMEQALQDYLPIAPDHPSSLHEAMQYATLSGGKRIRPLLVFAAGEIFGATLSRLVRCAAAVEMIHVNSLVHDDMPCMDDDDLRRGRPTVHIKYGEAIALLVGDALQSSAFFALSDRSGFVSADRQILMVRLLAQTVGSFGMCAGQAIDLQSEKKAMSLSELEHMHRLKTGALLRTSVLLGALSGNCPSKAELVALESYAHAIGLAFQIIDDVLDVTASTASLGKTAGKDARDGKSTYASLLGVEPAKAMAHTLAQEALDALEPFGDRAKRLREIAHLIAYRKA